MTKTIAIVNFKGGVGKTTTAVYLATLLSRSGSVLLKDADPQGSTTEWLEDIDELPFAFEIANIKNIGKTKDFDYVVIDTPPQNSEILKAAMAVADLSIVPMSTSELDLSRMISTLDYLPAESDYRILLTLADTRTNSFKYTLAVLEEAKLKSFANSVAKRESIKNTYGKIPKTKEELRDYEQVYFELEEILR